MNKDKDYYMATVRALFVVMLALGSVHGAYTMTVEDYTIAMRKKERDLYAAELCIEQWPAIPAFDKKDEENRARCDKVAAKWEGLSRAQQRETTALWQAVRSGNAKGVKRALGKKAYMENLDFFGVSPLRRAANDGNSEVIKLLLKDKACVDAGDKEYNKTALFCAAECGHIEAAGALLDGRANVNAAANACFDYKRPLMVAAENGHGDMVRLLLDRKADPCAQSSCVKMAHYYARKKGFVGIENILQEAVEKMVATHKGTSYGIGKKHNQKKEEEALQGVPLRKKASTAYQSFKGLFRRNKRNIASEDNVEHFFGVGELPGEAGDNEVTPARARYEVATFT